MSPRSENKALFLRQQSRLHVRRSKTIHAGRAELIQVPMLRKITNKDEVKLNQGCGNLFIRREKSMEVDILVRTDYPTYANTLMRAFESQLL